MKSEKESYRHSQTVLLMRCRRLHQQTVVGVAMAADCHTGFGFQFQPKLTLDFLGGEITSEAGLILLREFDQRLGLTGELRGLLVDERDARNVEHPALDLLRQRIYQIAAGYEDATFLRHDPTLRAVVSPRSESLASQPTLSRLENAAPGNRSGCSSTKGWSGSVVMGRSARLGRRSFWLSTRPRR